MGIVRKTKSVQVILQQFNQVKGALSVVDLVEGLQQLMNKTTVYRILERLEDDGILHSFTGKKGLKYYAKCNNCSAGHHLDTHPHFQCSDCGKTECLSVDVSIPAIPNHKVDVAELLLVGQCADCLA